MKPKTQDSFLMELAEAQQKLAEAGRAAELGDSTDDHAGLDCDFELPYSSLPKISTKRWKQ